MGLAERHQKPFKFARFSTEKMKQFTVNYSEQISLYKKRLEMKLGWLDLILSIKTYCYPVAVDTKMLLIPEMEY